jgi:SAM-dependent methyltransferase
MTIPACTICGADDLRLHYPRADDYITGDRFAIWRCGTCGSGRTLPSPADLGKYYPAQYRQYNSLVTRILAMLYRRRVGRWVRQFPAPGAVFEMGCGSGLMLDTLRRLGWRVAGSERTEAAAQIAREQFGLPVVVGGVDAINPSERFDLLLLNQVLEHLEDPAPTLKALAGFLKPEGKLIIGVPNFDSWQSMFGGNTWFHLDVPRHLHHFSLPSLAVLVGQLGLEIQSVAYASPEHDPYGWVQSALNRIDRRPNRLTRLLMRIDPADAINLLHLAVGCVLGLVAIPLSMVSWIARRGAIIEVICVRRQTR